MNLRKIGRQSTFLLNFIISLANTFLCFLHGLALPLPAYPIGPRYTQLRSTNLGLSFYNEPMQTFPSWNFTLTTVSTMLFKQNSQLGLFRYNEMHVYIRVETRHHYATFYVKTRFGVGKKGEKLITTTTTNNRAFTREFIVHTSSPESVISATFTCIELIPRCYDFLNRNASRWNDSNKLLCISV